MARRTISISVLRCGRSADDRSVAGGRCGLQGGPGRPGPQTAPPCDYQERGGSLGGANIEMKVVFLLTKSAPQRGKGRPTRKADNTDKVPEGRRGNIEINAEHGRRPSLRTVRPIRAKRHRSRRRKRTRAGARLRSVASPALPTLHSAGSHPINPKWRENCSNHSLRGGVFPVPGSPRGGPNMPGPRDRGCVRAASARTPPAQGT